MINLIYCNQCNKSNNLEIYFRFNYFTKWCKNCNHMDSRYWTYHFCNIKCFFQWAKENDIEQKGFPCESCKLTGFSFGFEQNGICTVCDGKKFVSKGQ